MASTDRQRPGPMRGAAARLFGYDVFVSFALGGPPRGSRSYASDLARRLRERDYTVFFSEDEAPAGEHLDHALKRALARSRILVVIANRGTLVDPRWVRAEVDEFRRRHPARPIIPVSIGGALQDPAVGPPAQAWLPWADRIWIDDTQAACDLGVVSEDALDRLATAPTGMRTTRLWRATLGLAFAVLAVLTAAALWFAWSDRQNARRAQDNAVVAADNAASANANAQTARRNEALAAANAASAASEAARAQRAEQDALREAEAARRAERLSRAGRLAAESQLARERDPALALLLAREAWQLDRIPEARRALYEALHEPVKLVLGSGLGELRRLAYAPDGRWVAAGGADERIHLWRIGDPRPARVLRAATPVRTLVFGADSRRLLSLDERARLQAWDPETGRPDGEAIAVPGLQRGWALAVRPDGGEMAIAGYEATDEQKIVFWDPAARRTLGEPIRLASNFGIYRLAYSPGGQRLAATVDGDIRVWNLATRALLVPPIRARPTTTFAAFVDEDRLVFDGPGYEATAWVLWDNRAEKPTYAGHYNWVESFAHSRAARLVATGDESGAIRVWRDDHASLATGGLAGHSWGVTGLAFGPDGTDLVSAGRDGRVLRWLLATDAWRHRQAAPPVLPAHEGADVTTSADRRWTVRLLRDRTLEWQGAGGTQRAGAAPARAREGLAVASDGSLALRAEDDSLTLHARGEARPRCTITTPVRWVRFRPDGRQLLSWTVADPTLRFWDADCRPLGTIARLGDNAAFRGVDWSGDGRWVWVAGQTSITAWDARRLQPLPGRALPVDDAFRIAVDPLGRYVAAAASQGSIRLFDLRRGGAALDLTGGHGQSGVQAMAFSADGLWMASVSDYGHALWDLATGQLAGRPTANRQGQLRDVHFSADSRTLVTVSTDGPDLHWELDAAVWADRACAAAHRNLGCSEWRRLVSPEAPYRPTCPQWPLPADAAACGLRPRPAPGRRSPGPPRWRSSAAPARVTPAVRRTARYRSRPWWRPCSVGRPRDAG